MRRVIAAVLAVVLALAVTLALGEVGIALFGLPVWTVIAGLIGLIIGFVAIEVERGTRR